MFRPLLYQRRHVVGLRDEYWTSALTHRCRRNGGVQGVSPGLTTEDRAVNEAPRQTIRRRPDEPKDGMIGVVLARYTRGSQALIHGTACDAR